MMTNSLLHVAKDHDVNDRRAERREARRTRDNELLLVELFRFSGFGY